MATRNLFLICTHFTQSFTMSLVILFHPLKLADTVVCFLLQQENIGVAIPEVHVPSPL